jgi:hypothetical protein
MVQDRTDTHKSIEILPDSGRKDLPLIHYPSVRPSNPSSFGASGVSGL